MDLPQRTQRAPRKRINFGFRISDFGLDCRACLCALCVLCGEFFFVSGHIVAAPQEVVLVDGATFRGELVSIGGDGGVTFRAADTMEKKGEIRTLTLDELVRWGHPAALRPQPVVVLADGGRIISAADWAGGAVVKLDGDDLVVASDMWDEVRLGAGW